MLDVRLTGPFCMQCRNSRAARILALRRLQIEFAQDSRRETPSAKRALLEDAAPFRNAAAACPSFAGTASKRLQGFEGLFLQRNQAVVAKTAASHCSAFLVKLTGLPQEG